MRTLAIDLGARRVGLALSDAGGKLASPFDVLSVVSAEQAIDPILKLIQNESVQRVVIGLPLNMDDSLGPAARAAVAWGKQLQSRCYLPIIFVDERLSSGGGGVSPGVSRRRAQAVDEHARMTSLLRKCIKIGRTQQLR
jgi:putative Holliday junction resolvase